MKNAARFAVLLFLAFTAFGRLLPAPFLYDDRVVLQENRLLRSFDGLGAIWRGHIDSRREMDGAYRPLLLTAVSGIGRLIGFRPTGFRLFGLLLHTLNALLLLTLARRLFALPRLASWLAALIFLLHPLQTTSLAIVWKQSDLWVALGALSSLLVWPKIPLASVGIFIVSLGFKESAVILPLLWLVTEPLQPSAQRTRRIVTASSCLLLSVTWLYLLRYLAQTPALSDGFPGGRLDYFRTQLGIYPLYLRDLLWPTALTIDRSVPLPTAFSFLQIFTLLVASAIVGITSWRSWRRSPAGTAALLGLLWLIPTSTFHPLSLLYDETRLYLTVGFLASAVAAWLAPIASRIPLRPLLAFSVAGTLAVLLVFRSSVETERFRSEERLWSAAVRVDPTSVRGHYQLGVLAREARTLDEAEIHQQMALSLNPGFEPSHLELGIVLGRKGDLDGAAREFSALLSSTPHWSALGHYHLGLDALYRKDVPRAKREFGSVLQLVPGSELAAKAEDFLATEPALR